MLLSEFEDKVSKIKVMNDAEFDRLDYANSKKFKGKILTYIKDEIYLKNIYLNPNITCIIVTKEIYPMLNNYSFGLVVSEDPKEAFLKIHNLMAAKSNDFLFESRIETSSTIFDSNNIAKNNVIIGKNCYIESNVIIYPNVTIKDNVIIRSGSIIGCQGFHFFRKNGEILPIITSGSVLIESYVEIQHNSCVDRGVIGGETIIRKNCKIDKFVHIAHDCEIGEATLIAAGVRFGGVTKVGKNCWIGLNATISNGISISDNCKISLGSVVTKDLDENSHVSGNFAIDHEKFLSNLKLIR